MAYLSISGNNASYKLTLSGMSTSLRYHVFIVDLSSSGGVNGYKCVRSSKGTSSSWTYSGSSGSPYSNYDRGVYVRSTTAATSHVVGNVYTWSQVFNGTTEVDSGTIPAASGGGGTTYTTYGLNLRTGEGIASYNVRYLGASGSSYNTASVSNPSASTVCWTRARTNLEVTSINYSSNYGAPFYFKEYTDSSFTTVKNTFADNDDQVYSSGTRYVKLFATRQITYVNVRYYKNGGTWSSGSDPYVDTVESGSYSSTATPSGRLSRTNYRLLGWSTSSTATSAPYGTNEAIGPLGTDLTLYAVWKETTCTVSLYANGGFYQDGGTSSTVKQQRMQIGQSLEFKAYTDLLSNTDNNYELLGWSRNQSANLPEYGKYGSVLITDDIAKSPSFYAIWGRIFYVKCGKGIQKIGFSGSVWQPSETTSQSFQKIILKANDPTITITPTALSGYSSPFKYYYQPNEGGQITGSSKFTGSLSYTWNSSRKYVTIDAQKIIPNFYWCGSDEQDNIKIVKDQPVANLTAASWNNLKDTITELGKGLEITVSPGSHVSSGAQITAAEFNRIRAAIRQLSSTPTLPAAVKQGDTIKASYFNGGGSLKSAINWIIYQYNS